MFLRGSDEHDVSYLRLGADVEVTRVELLGAFLSPLDQGFLERRSLRVAHPPETIKKEEKKTEQQVNQKANVFDNAERK